MDYKPEFTTEVRDATLRTRVRDGLVGSFGGHGWVAESHVGSPSRRTRVGPFILGECSETSAVRRPWAPLGVPLPSQAAPSRQTRPRQHASLQGQLRKAGMPLPTLTLLLAQGPSSPLAPVFGATFVFPPLPAGVTSSPAAESEARRRGSRFGCPSVATTSSTSSSRPAWGRRGTRTGRPSRCSTRRAARSATDSLSRWRPR